MIDVSLIGHGISQPLTSPDIFVHLTSKTSQIRDAITECSIQFRSFRDWLVCRARAISCLLNRHSHIEKRLKHLMSLNAQRSGNAHDVMNDQAVSKRIYHVGEVISRAGLGCAFKKGKITFAECQEIARLSQLSERLLFGCASHQTLSFEALLCASCRRSLCHLKILRCSDIGYTCRKDSTRGSDERAYECRLQPSKRPIGAPPANQKNAAKQNGADFQQKHDAFLHASTLPWGNHVVEWPCRSDGMSK